MKQAIFTFIGIMISSCMYAQRTEKNSKVNPPHPVSVAPIRIQLACPQEGRKGDTFRLQVYACNFTAQKCMNILQTEAKGSWVFWKKG